ncbi:uncharacterized protein Nmag_2291 [Natrialba magadii ATCC 43099]|uniref:Actinobacteria/chloroflexi VLRF1 release factor domain-containing protein n=1 Tax=Natrialba magadii (strain ATCC 43099 / DSM 3394 / CCM 3739 / CIP 104546 / IAM 13178 / JCM 8861 / NBRC 102185 / NCIMB 2190 / MS3) TaxID=547559 RepID=D3SWX3_NATMM|nr:Vms1/Ankzf1 family peptidyl-tRNA hydrolase [Natrialba magadii]ADD05855.1 uncharacterized protein Nmag_2291 [Natrialba magadii ATCC 43099]ELY30637.1 hypothetical protein C500_08957 [Natrialba magadii ATCC 43099]
MLDELLGRASLKERIDELEEERDSLKARYEAESERRADAATAKQEAEAAVNRLEDRIAQLEGELERLEDDDAATTGLEYTRQETLRGGRLEEVLDRLESVRTEPEGALTAVVSAEDDLGSAGQRERHGPQFDSDLAAVLGERTVLVDEAAPCLLCVDDAGLVSVVLEPPVLPGELGSSAGGRSDTRNSNRNANASANANANASASASASATRANNFESGWRDRFTLEREWFLPTGRSVLALVRTDLFAVGVYDGDERVAYRGFESDVKGSHSKGGFSQARFERIRDGQIDDHLDDCRDALADVLADEPDARLFLTGQRGVIETLADESELEPDATAAVDATGDPKDALEDAYGSFWTTELSVL